MDRKKKIKRKMSSRNWLCVTSRRLGYCLVLVCFSSVGLNLYLLFFRNLNLTQSTRSADDTSHVVFDNWAAGYDNLASIQEIYITLAHQRLVVPVEPFTRNANTNATGTHVTQSHATTRVTNTALMKKWRGGSRLTTTLAAPGESVKGNTSKCPLNPPKLVGPLRAMMANTDPETLRKSYTFIERGGRIRPTHCVPRERTAFIIPFRNRQTHLHILLHNLIPLLQRQLIDATVFIIEQAPPTTFNRGALLNVGFLEALKVAKFDCFVMHDVDLLPLNDRNLYRCGNNPRHYAVSMRTKAGYRTPYPTYFGGVVGFSRDQYLRINGNSNLYFGWGGEDDDLWLRAHNKNYTVDRYDGITSRYQMIQHDRDKGNAKNIERKNLMKSALKRQDVEGLNTTKYKVINVRLDTLYTWINVSLDMNQILQTAPDYTKADVWKQFKTLRFQKKT